jgi:hypothetical protein
MRIDLTRIGVLLGRQSLGPAVKNYGDIDPGASPFIRDPLELFTELGIVRRGARPENIV